MQIGNTRLDIPRLQVLVQAGIDTVSYATLMRRLHRYADDAWRHRLAAACAAHARFGPTSLVLYYVSVRHEALVVRVEQVAEPLHPLRHRKDPDPGRRPRPGH
jgi:hypothetical protein